MIKQLFFLVSFFFVTVSFAHPCIEHRGAMDFGSGTTKALVIKVDSCKKKILGLLYEERLPLALNEAMEKAGDQKIPMATVTSAYPQLEKLVERVKAHDVTGIRAVATSVFRVAKNGPEVAKMIAKHLGLSVEVISQEREAELGYWSALAQKESLPQESFIVWDIGGGSMQMYARVNTKTEIFEGNLASVTFKNKILEVLQFKNPLEVSSPNPLGRNKDAAVQLAKNHAILNVPRFFKRQNEKSRWIGVGGVLSMSIQKQVNKKDSEFTQEELEQTLANRAHLKDSEIQSDYRISEITNLALVLGYMKALGIKKVETVQASLGQGLIYQELQH